MINYQDFIYFKINSYEFGQSYKYSLIFENINGFEIIIGTS